MDWMDNMESSTVNDTKPVVGRWWAKTEDEDMDTGNVILV